MAEKTLAVRHKQKYDTASNWTTNNPVLLAGEIGFESDTQKFKIGDGTTAWNSLVYVRELYYCTYGTTTYAQITSALSAGKLPVCIYSNREYIYSVNEGGYHYLTNALANSAYYIRVNTSGVWTNSGLTLERTSNKVTSISNTSTDAQYPSAKLLYDQLALKQGTLPTTTTAGQVLKSTSTSGTVEWGTVSGGGSTDVKINNTSITSNNVANIVTNGTYNSSTNKIATMSDTIERIDLLYDMRSNDSTINRGLTSGATCGTTFRLDYSVYTSIRLYCSINNCEVMKVLKTAERKKSDFSVNAINSTFDKVNYLRFTFPTNNTVLQVGQYGIYSFDLNNNTFSVAKGAVHTSFYVYRLEGIY